MRRTFMIRWSRAWAYVLMAAAPGSYAAAAHGAAAYGAGADPASDRPLTLQDATRLALLDQPILNGREASIEAARQQAVAAAQLPDPKLSGGLKELPMDTPEAFSLRRDNFTEFTVGISQEFTRAEKRHLRGARRSQGADVDRAALDNDARSVRRDASLAWLEVYEAEQAYRLTQRLIDESALQVRALEKDYAAGKASQADVL